MTDDPTATDKNDEQRLRELLRATAPDSDTISFGQLAPVHQGRPSRRRSAIIAAAAAVLVVLAVDMVVSRLGSPSGPTVTAPKVTIGSAPTRPRQDELAKAAPCRLTMRDQHPATAMQVAAFTPVAVVSCSTETRIYPGDGEWTVRVRKVATNGLRAAMTALTRADEHGSPTACASIGYGPLMILLVNGAGQYLHPRAPTDVCGAPQAAVGTALNALHWRTVSATRIVQVRTPASIASRCEMRWKNELVYEGRLHESSTTAVGPVFSNYAGTRLRVCLYRTTTDILGGDFQRSITLTGAMAERLRSALSDGPPTGPCHAQHAFATVWAARQWVNVELGGCWRVLREDPASIAVGTANPDQLRQLLGIG